MPIDRTVFVLLPGRMEENDAYQLLQSETALAGSKLLGVDACPGYGQRLVDDGTLAASVVAPPNAGLALELLHRFWTEGRPLPLRSFTAPRPYPPA